MKSNSPNEAWQWLDTGAHDAAMNMAIDEALLEGIAARGAPLFRVYQWTRPSISIGYFQPYPKEYESTHEIVRRPTGGGVVFHGKDLTFTFVAPPFSSYCQVPIADCYHRLHALLVDALTKAGLKCELFSGPKRAETNACFESPVQYDIMMKRRKICGGAQRRTKYGLLHQGSLLLPPSQRTPIEELKSTLHEKCAVRWLETFLTKSEIRKAESLCAKKFSTTSWTRKRACPRPSVEDP